MNNKSIRRVAMIFDNTARRDTTGVYCRRAMSRFVEVEHFLPAELGRLSREPFDLYIAIDDGMNYSIPPDLHPSVYWAIDTHLDFERELQRALAFDFVFAAQRDGANRFRQHGISSAHWLPLACDPEIHGKQEVAKQYDICFVGNNFPGPREDLLRLIQGRFPNSFVGRRFFAEMAQTYSQSRLVFNRSLRNDVNMRVFEALASGSLLVTNDLRENGQDELFRDGLHLATYRDADELIDKVNFYLHNPELGERVAETGRQAVLAKHTYQHRMQLILDMAEDQLARRRPSAPRGIELPAAAIGTVTAMAGPRNNRGGQVGLTSIIVVTCGQLEYTRLCLDSIKHFTAEPYELIVVDNGSTDGTVDYLRLRQDIVFIVNSENRGFPAAANQGIVAAKGEQILLLNNDTVVTRGWLRRMLETLHSDHRIGLVGPCSNNVSGEQQVSVTYDRLESLDPFAQEWGLLHNGQTVDTDRLVGFCLLIRREVVDQIGLLDVRFGIGNFEDDDFCRRAQGAGYRAVIARSSFVHHFRHRTFLGNGVDFGALLAENERKFRDKWGIEGTAARVIQNGIAQNGDAGADTRISEQPALTHIGTVSGQGKIEVQIAFDSSPNDATRPVVHPNGQPESNSIIPSPPRPSPQPPLFTVKRGLNRGLLLVPNSLRLSLCMIVRDNEATIGPALESIFRWVDEIVVVDTGSRDKTLEICRQYGARVYEFPWCDDFSAARNESLKYARGEWIFWMDSDDTISPECGKRLRELAERRHPDNALGFVMQVHCPRSGEDDEVEVTIVDHVKLVRNRPDLRFEGRIHEQILPSIRRAEGEVFWTDIHVRHSGADHSPAGWQRKLERDLRILHLELQASPRHPFVLFNLGMTYADTKRYPEAIGYLEKCLEVSDPDESHVRKAFALLTSSLFQAQRHADAWQSCQRGLSRFSDDKELLFRSAMLHHHFGRLRDAETAYLQVINDRTDRHLTSIDRNLAGYKARHNLALVYDDMRRLDLAEAQWRQIVQQAPTHVDGWRALVDVLLRAGKLEEVEKICGDLSARNGRLGRESHLLRARLAVARNDLPAAIPLFELADRQDPQNLTALQALCQVLVEGGEFELAEQRLRELTSRAPSDAAAFHNLGIVYYRRGAFSQAAAAFERSVGLRPNAPETRTQWGWSLGNTGRLQDAINVWHETLRRFPGHKPSMAALEAAGAAAGAGNFAAPGSI